MLLAALVMVAGFSNPSADRAKTTPVKREDVAEMVASWNARFQTLWKTNEGIGTREERVMFRAWSGKDKRFSEPIEQVDARRIDRRSGGTTFVLSGKKVTGGRPEKNSEITDKDGTVWVVGAVEVSDRDYSCSVRKK